jgi:hypothetical protein
LGISQKVNYFFTVGFKKATFARGQSVDIFIRYLWQLQLNAGILKFPAPIHGSITISKIVSGDTYLVPGLTQRQSVVTTASFSLADCSSQRTSVWYGDVTGVRIICVHAYMDGVAQVNPPQDTGRVELGCIETDMTEPTCKRA